MAFPLVGEQAEVDASFSAVDVRAFAELTGDANPVHLDDEEARRLGFSGKIVHGMLTASLISRLLGMHLPGPGTIYLSQALKFLRPIYPGEPLRAEVAVIETRPDKRIVTLSTRVWARGELALDGSAVILLRDQA